SAGIVAVLRSILRHAIALPARGAARPHDRADCVRLRDRQGILLCLRRRVDDRHRMAESAASGPGNRPTRVRVLCSDRAIGIGFIDARTDPESYRYRATAAK